MATIKSIEEKAKRYDEAIEIINDYYQKTRYSSLSCASNDIEVLEKAFPELKESEGEKIRKEIISALKYANHKGVYDKHLAWLEKQGEHAKFCDSIQVGDKVTRNQDGMLVNLSQLNRVAKKDEKQGKNNMGISEATKRKLEDNLNKALEKETPESWNKFLDEQGEQKPAEWSEKDEDTLHCIIDALDSLDIRTNTNGEHENHTEEIYWLKSLKDRYTWKPSENELEVLRLAAEKDGTCLMGLYENLKKLREE